MAEHLSARQCRPSKMRRKKRRIGAFSRRLTFSDLDGRTNAGKYVNSIKNDLEAQIGDRSPGQQIQIKLVAVKMLRCEMMYERVVSQPMSKQSHDQGRPMRSLMPIGPPARLVRRASQSLSRPRRVSFAEIEGVVFPPLTD